MIFVSVRWCRFVCMGVNVWTCESMWCGPWGCMRVCVGDGVQRGRFLESAVQAAFKGEEGPRILVVNSDRGAPKLKREELRNRRSP